MKLTCVTCEEVVKRLLEEPRIDPGAFYDSLIRNAAWYEQFDVVELLLKDPRVDPEALSTHSEERVRELYLRYSRE